MADDAALVAASRDAALALLLGNCGPTLTCDGAPWSRVLANAALSLEVFDAPVPASALRRFKAVAALPFPPAAVAAALADHAARMVWDRNIALLEEVELQAAPFRATLLHSRTKAVGPIAGRDFVDACVALHLPAPPAAGPEAWVAAPGSIAAGGIGVRADARFPETPAAVRGYNTPGSGWVFEPADGGAATRVHYCIHVDLAGWLPTMLVNSSIAGSYVSFFTDLGRHLAARVAQ